MKPMHAMVIDNGSGTCKCGFSGDETPTTIFPSVVGRNKNAMMDYNPYWVGEEAFQKRHIRYPVEQGLITNWCEMEKLWKHTFYNGLKVNPEEHAVLLTETPQNPKNNREKTTCIMFENFNVPGLYVGIQAVLSLYAYGKTTGIVLDSGHDVTHVVPIYEGCAIHHNVSRMNLAGRDINEYLSLFFVIREKNIVGFTNSFRVESIFVNNIKESLGYVALNYKTEIKKANTESHCDVEYELPDKKKFIIGSERFQAPEIMFQPSFIESELPGIHEMVFNSIMKCDIDLQEQLFNNIVLSGGSTMFEGFVERLDKEISNLASSTNTSFRIHASSKRKYYSWIGGSIISSLSSMSDMWITKDEYEENGPRIILSKCFTGGGVCGFVGFNVDSTEDEDLRNRISYCCEEVNIVTFTFDGNFKIFSLSKCFLML